MTNNDLDELKRLAQAIVDPKKTVRDLIPEAVALRDFFERKTNFQFDPSVNIASGETRLDSGLAVSPTIAAMCLRELARSAGFIRGMYQAIGDALQADRPVRVLYAGCGPYALLALPSMALLSPDRVRFTLLDVHQEALDRALALIDAFGFSDFLDDALCADATRYRIPPDQQPDIILSETMAVCLRNEPQVAIARHLLSQAPEARMVPQSVSVEAWLLNPSKEFTFMPAGHTGPIPEPERDRVYLGQVFELSAANVRAWENIQGDSLPAGRVSLPSELEKRYLPYLLTKIVVYGDNGLQDYDSSLTMPRNLRETPAAGATLQFRYILGAHPELAYEVVA
ncbi:MAG: class I SAM-dependent methyltransferase [Betaproteobacteria bacterium]|nr:class I SAM-dependent methyltransferase [Betaproteobacteria bacterium]